jgi:hypothetical protein
LPLRALRSLNGARLMMVVQWYKILLGGASRGFVGANLIQPSARLRIAARRDEGIVNFNELSASDLRDARNTPPTCSKWRMDTSAILPHGLVTRRAAHMFSVTAELRALAPLCRAVPGGPGLPAPMPQAGAASLIPLSNSSLSLRRGFRSIAFRLTGLSKRWRKMPVSEVKS